MPGSLSAGLYWFFWVVTGIADVIAITGYVKYWWPDIPAFAPALTVIVALLLLNLPSVKNFGEIEFWFAVIKIVAIVLLIVVGALMVAFSFTSPDGTVASVANLWDHPGPPVAVSSPRPDGLPGCLPDCTLRLCGR